MWSQVIILAVCFLYCAYASTESPRAVVVVGSMHEHLDRRMRMRELWSATDTNNQQLDLLFFLDALEPDEKALTGYESKMFGDVVGMSVPTGLRMAERILFQFKYIDATYGQDYEYIVFSDDDVFWCTHELRRFLNTLFQKTNKAMAGFLHKFGFGQWFDHYALVIQRDIVHEIVQQSQSLECAPFGDVSLSRWIFHDLKLKNVQVFESPDVFSHVKYKNSIHRLAIQTELAPICRTTLNYHYVHTHDAFAMLLDLYMNNIPSNATESTPTHEYAHALSETVARMFQKLQHHTTLTSQDGFVSYMRGRYKSEFQPCNNVSRHAWEHILKGKKHYYGGL